MEGGPPGFEQGFTCPALLGIPLSVFTTSHTGLSPTMVQLSRSVPLSFAHATLWSRNPIPQAGWFRLFPFRSPLLRKSRLISTPPGTEMFHFPGYCPEALCIQTPVSRHYAGWVAPFGNRRINGCMLLPDAYRSLPRPSSPIGAKAFIARSYTLDTISFYLSKKVAFPLSMQMSKNNSRLRGRGLKPET